MDKLSYRLISYNVGGVTEEEVKDFSPLQLAKDGSKYWLDITNLKDVEGITGLAKRFGIHDLIIEDILNTNQMVKLDNYDDCLFMVFKMLRFERDKTSISTEHVSLVLKGNCVISFHQFDNDIFEGVRGKILNGKDNIRKLGADYLCYELIDTVVDNYFGVIDEIGDIADEIEEELISKPEKSTLQRIYFVKRELMFLRKSVFPLRELIGSLYGADVGQMGEGVHIYFRDVYDHLIQIVDSVETYQDILSNMLDIYLSSVSNRTNETMKVLTIISTIFIPLTFIVGIYGMNLSNMPELTFKYSYLIFWIISIIIVCCMLMFFHKKKWF